MLCNPMIWTLCGSFSDSIFWNVVALFGLDIFGKIFTNCDFGRNEFSILHASFPVMSEIFGLKMLLVLCASIVAI
jgi:hypothetical protein